MVELKRGLASLFRFLNRVSEHLDDAIAIPHVSADAARPMSSKAVQNWEPLGGERADNGND